MKTRAAVVRRQGGSFSFEDVEIDDPRPGEVIVRIVAGGVCHTDIAGRDGLLGMQFPAVFGHEGAGVVERVGQGVSSLGIGDKVVLSFSSCGECAGCREGKPARCVSFDELNFGGTRLDGSPAVRDAAGHPVSAFLMGQSSLAFHALTRERNTVRVDAADNNALATLAPLGCGIQAGAGTVLNELKPRPGRAIAVFGTGTVGLAAVMAARLAGASPIIAVDKIASRLDLARELGATAVIDGGREDVGAGLAKIAKNIDYAVETTGLSRLIDIAIRALTPDGKASLLGISADAPGEGVSPKRPGPRQKVFYSIAGDSNPQEFLPFLIRNWRAGNFPFDRLIREYAASRINEAIEDSVKGITVKPVLRFS